MTMNLTVICAAHRGPGGNGVRFTLSDLHAGQQPFPGKSSARQGTGSVLQALCGRRRAARSVAITFSLLSLLLNTAGASGAFPEFDSCPERVARALQEHASTGPDHHGAHQSHPVAPHSHPDPGTAHADSPDDNGGFCDCCQGFFLAHLSGIPVAITVPIFPARSVDHSGLRRMTLEFASAPPVPPPKPYLV